jgi:hypothetical protein
MGKVHRIPYEISSPQLLSISPLSEMVREEISHILEDGGVHSGTNLLSVQSELGVRYFVQQALEREQEDFLGCG